MKRLAAMLLLACAACSASTTPTSCEDAGACSLVDGGAGKCCGYGTDCVDLSSDPNNCSSCGEVCLPGQTCSGGNCV